MRLELRQGKEGEKVGRQLGGNRNSKSLPFMSPFFAVNVTQLHIKNPTNGIERGRQSVKCTISINIFLIMIFQLPTINF